MESTCSQCDSIFTAKSIRSKLCGECQLKKRRDDCKKYKRNHKEAISRYNTSYKQQHKEDISEYNKKYDAANRSKIQTQRNIYQRQRRSIDPHFKMMHIMRTRMNKFMKGKKCNTTLKLLDCSKGDFTRWIEYQFSSDMTWENHGTVWHYDHVIPCSLFDHSIDTEQEKCYHWSNIRPMKCIDNIIKNNTISEKEIDNHDKIIESFIKENFDHLSNEMTTITFDKREYVNV